MRAAACNSLSQEETGTRGEGESSKYEVGKQHVEIDDEKGRGLKGRKGRRGTQRGGEMDEGAGS